MTSTSRGSLSTSAARLCARADGLTLGEIDMAAFRLGDDLLRHHQDVAVRRRECAALAGRDQQAGEIVAGPDQGNVGDGDERDDH